MGDRSASHSERPPATANRRELSGLSQRLLRLASSSDPLADFLSEVTRPLLDFFSCDAVELWVKRENAWLHCEARNGNEQTFHVKANPSGKSPPMAIGRVVRPRSLTLPVEAVGEIVGYLKLKRRQQGRFSEKNLESYAEVAQALGLALMNQLAHAALHERVKELTCLYGLAQLVEPPDATLDEILQGIVEKLPPAWQYPNITAARITLDGHTYQTANFSEGRHRQSADIAIGGRRHGEIDVVYVEPRPDLDEGPFLKEERSLIDAVARQIALFVERRRASEEKQRLQGQLRHADRLATIGQLSAGVAHELNEPLGNILAFAQLAEKQPDLPRQTAEDLQKIVAAAMHSREIIKKLMLFARQMPPQKMPVDLNTVVREGLFFLESRAARNGVVVRRRLGRRLPKIVADPSQLHQVLVNLLVNAIHAMPGGGTLGIATRAAKQGVVLVVTDTGDGMSADVLEKIFVPFFTTKDVNEGTGLGLSVVHGIVQAHGGTIAVRSKLGKGTRFEVRLPLDIKPRPSAAD